MLSDKVRDVLRVKHYSLRTEEAYLGWMRRYILFHKQTGLGCEIRWIERQRIGESFSSFPLRKIL